MAIPKRTESIRTDRGTIEIVKTGSSFVIRKLFDDGWYFPRPLFSYLQKDGTFGLPINTWYFNTKEDAELYMMIL